VASVRKRGKNWHVQIRRKGLKPITRTFPTKGAASAWARKTEYELDIAQCPDDISALTRITLGDLIERYRDTVTPSKRSVRQETSRMNFLLRQEISSLTLDRLTTGVFARFRDERLKQVGPQMVLHDLHTLSVVLRTAKMDWDVPLTHVPVDAIRKPRMPPGRDRRLREGEFERLKEAALSGHSPYIWNVIEFAIETAMRKGEIRGLEWQHIYWKDRIAHLSETKNGLPRDVPLSLKAVSILEDQKRQNLPRPFPYSDRAVYHSWQTATTAAGIVDFHFHDLRHEAISRFFEKGLSVPEVAVISGHKDFRMLARYTHLTAENLVKSL